MSDHEVGRLKEDLRVLRVKYAATHDCKEEAWEEVARLTRERDALIDAAIWEGVDPEYGGQGWTWQIGSWPPHPFLTTKERAIAGVRRAAGLTDCPSDSSEAIRKEAE